MTLQSGPTHPDAGLLLSITLEARSAKLPHFRQQLVVQGDFENVAGVDLTTDPGVAYEVTDPAVFSVSSSGLSGSGTVNIFRTRISPERSRSFLFTVARSLTRKSPPILPPVRMICLGSSLTATRRVVCRRKA